MKKKLVSVVLAIAMIVGMLPTLSLAANESPAPIVYDFSTAAFSDYSTPNTSLNKNNVNNYTIDPSKSAKWRYVNIINCGSIGFQKDGLCFYTPAKTSELNSNAVILTAEVAVAGSYVPAIEHTEIAYGEKTDVYMVRKDFVTANNIDILTIDGVKAGIAVASMTNPDADVKFIASYDTHPNATVEDKLAKKINLTAGEYYIVLVANEGSVNYAAERTYGMFSKLTLNPYVDESKKVWTYDFSATAFTNYSGSGNLNESGLKNSTLDRTKSTGFWKLEGSINEKYVAAIADGLYFYTPKKNAPLNSNAVICNFTVEVDGTFVPSVERSAVAYCEKVDLYLVKKDTATAKGWDVLTIDGVQSAIAAASMTDAYAEVKYLASYDAHPNATVADAYAEKVKLTAGDYWLIAVANEGSVNYTSEERTYGTISKLILTPDDPDALVTYSYNLTKKAYAPGTTASSIKITAITSENLIDRKVSTGTWAYCNMKNIPGTGMYDDGIQFYAMEDKIGENFLVLKATVGKKGYYKPSLIFNKAGYTGRVNVYVVPAEYADSKWKMTSDNLNIAEVVADSGVTKALSVDTHKNSTESSPYYGNNFSLTKGQVYIIFTLEKGAAATSDKRYYGYLQSFDLNEQVKPPELTAIEVDFGDVRVGDKLSAEIKWFDGEDEITEANGTVAYEISDNDNNVLIDSNGGDIYAIAEGEAKIKVSGTFNGVTKSDEVTINVLPSAPLSGVDQEYLFHNGAYGDFSQAGLNIAGAKANRLVTEDEFMQYEMRDYGTDRPWGMVSARLTRPDSKSTYLGSNANYTDLSGYAGDWVAYKVKVPKAGKYNVDVRGLSYASAGRAEVYMLPYSADMTFSSITSNIDSYCVEENLVADADLYGTGDTVACRAFAGQFVASDELDYSNGYAEYLMIVKECNSRVNSSKYAVLLKGIYLVGTPREIQVTTKLYEDTIGVGEAVTVESVTGKFADGGTLNFDGAEFIFEIADEDKDILKYDSETGEIIGLSEGVGTVKTCVVVNGTVSHCETEVTVDNDYKVIKTYLYTNNKVMMGEELLFTTGFELSNRKVFAGGTIESLEIINPSEEGIAIIAEDGKTVRAIKAGTFEVSAKIRVRGKIVESVPEKIVVFSEEMAPSSVVEINFMQGTYLGDNYTRLNDILAYTDYRPWIFHSIGNINPSYPDILLATQKAKYGQIGWKSGANIFDSYIAFKVKFPKTSTYLAEGYMGLSRYRSAAFDLYIMPATEEFESNILSYAVPTSEYYVGTADFYSKADFVGMTKIFGAKEVTEGEKLVVYRISESGAAGSGGDSCYPLTFSFADEEAFGGAELVTESGSNIIALDETVNTLIKLKTVKGAEIEYAEGDITAVVYKSENENIATVDASGAITGISEGEAKIIATITYDGITKKAEYTVSVSDNSGIIENGISIKAPDSIYVYGGSKLGVIAEMNSGKTLDIPDEFITWELVDGAEYAELSEDGNVYGIGVGTALISATVSADYKNGAAEGITIEPLALDVTWDANVDPQIYTLEQRENAKNNAAKYSWARDEVKAKKAEADKYVEHLDLLYSLIASEGLPRYYHIGHMGDPTKNFCRYCGADIGTLYGGYGWKTNAISRPWKVQCPDCNRVFPSNDFGLFYKLGLADDGTFLIDRALQKHHEMFVCEDVKAGGECSHVGKFPSYTTKTPGTAEWKTELDAWNNARESQEWKDHYGYNVKGGYLTNNLYPEIDTKLGISGWGVDDGFGYKMPYISYERAKEIAGEDGDVTKVPGYDPRYYDNGNGYAWYADGTRKGPVQYSYIAYFIHEGMWYGQGNVVGSAALRKAINSLAEAFVYTGEAKYGRAGAILLDRIADFYSDFSWFKWHNWRGDDYYGAIVDPVWNTFISYEFAKAYDAFKPIYNDPAVIKYLSEKSPQYKKDVLGNWIADENGELIPVNLKDSPGAVRKNVEDNILLATYRQTRYGDNWGNFGMHQKSVAAAAVALNRMPESGEMIDWIFAPGPVSGTSGISTGPLPRTTPVSGGMFLGALINDIDRDGSATENAPGYNSLWIQNFLGVADLLRGFDLYPQADLYDNAKFTKMFAAQIRLTLGGYYTTHTGDSGAIGGTGLAVYTDDILQAYKNTKDPLLAQTLWLMKETYGDQLRGTILDENPDQLEKEIEHVIETYGKLNLESDMLSGYGFAALRAGGEFESASSSSYNNTHRDFAIYFGRNNMHGHRDTLNLFADAYGLNIAPDIGYPEETGQQPNRFQWVRTTISHNTVVVDEKEQGEGKVAQTPIHFDDSGKVKVMDINADVYDNTDEYRRSVIMVEVDDENSYGIDFFHIKGGNDHLYSFHSQSDEHTAISGLGDMYEQPMYTDDAGNVYGTYAGPDVKYGADPGGVNSEIYPRGYTWLREVRTYKSIDKNFTVEFNVKDWKNVMEKKRDVRLRLTMLNDQPVSEVSFAKALPPQTKSNKHVTNLEYMLVRNRGTNLDTVFTTVFEPYDVTNKYIDSIEKVPMVRDENSKPGVLDAYSAVKITLKSGRIDYVIYSTNASVDYIIDDKISFRGFAGVISFDNEGNVVYTYLNDGEVLKLVDSEMNEAFAAYTGTVQSFTEELSKRNYIIYKPDMETDVDALAGKYVYVANDGAQNGAYRIESASVENGNIKLDIGDVSIIRSFVNANNTALGYVYNISNGDSLRIPMPSIMDSSPVFEDIEDLSATVGSSARIPLRVESPIGKDIKIIGTSLPRGMSISEDGINLTWKPDSSQVGKNHVAITATDGTLDSTIHFSIDVYGSTTGDKPSAPSNPETPGTPTIPSTPGSGTGSSGAAGGGGGSSAGGVSGSSSGGASSAPETTPTEPSTPGVPNDNKNDSNVRFVDLGNHSWAADAINALADEGIIKGTSENTFSPAANITRADFAILLVRAFKLASESEENFTDVSASDYFAKELAVARNTGLVNGIGENKFAPRNNITRQDMMVIVYRALVAMEKKFDTTAISASDFYKVADYAKEAAAALVNAGLINGKNGLVDPTANTTRAEVAVLIKRILDYTK